MRNNRRKATFEVIVLNYTYEILRKKMLIATAMISKYNLAFFVNFIFKYCFRFV